MIFLLNDKAYKESFGKAGLALAQAVQKAQGKTKMKLGICPQVQQLALVKSKMKVPVYAQHVDMITPGSHTGYLSVDALKAEGMKGTLLNHSEHQIPLRQIRKTIGHLKAHKLEQVVCVPTLRMAKKVAKYKPTMVAYEPPALIGGDISVTSSKPEVITKVVEAVKAISPKTKILVGAGVKTNEDVRVAKALGAHGVLLASGVVKAKDPYKKILEMVR